LQVDPKASVHLSHAGMGSHLGGPLTVKIESESDGLSAGIQLLESRFTGAVEISASLAQRIHAGTPVRVRVGATTKRIGTHVWRALAGWISRQLEGSPIGTL
jgi:hypothetical protein